MNRQKTTIKQLISYKLINLKNIVWYVIIIKDIYQEYYIYFR